MTPSPSHPSLDQWVEWVQSGKVEPELEEHLVGCSGCRSLVETLRLTRGRERKLVWKQPPLGTLESRQRLLNDAERNLQRLTHGHRGQRIQQIVPTRDG